jgi:hypothetical protein
MPAPIPGANMKLGSRDKLGWNRSGLDGGGGSFTAHLRDGARPGWCLVGEHAEQQKAEKKRTLNRKRGRVMTLAEAVVLTLRLLRR